MENQTEALNQLEVGQLVKSRAGRDLGSYYLVYRLASRGGKQTKAWLVDGRGRTAANPKAKNPRHLQRTRLVSGEFAAKLANGCLTPEDIRAALNSLLAEHPTNPLHRRAENPDKEALANVES